MTFKKSLAAALLVAAVGFQPLYAQDEKPFSKMTQAVMNSYDSMLSANPKDYKVYFRRANEYFNHNMMSKALSDINNALLYMPASEKDMQFQCLSVRGAIYEATGHHQEALADHTKALEINPKSFAERYHLALCQHNVGDYQGAESSYKQLLGIDSRNLDAVFGLANTYAAAGDEVRARQMADDAVSIKPTAYYVYTRRGDILKNLGDTHGAAADYVKAVSLASGAEMTTPLRKLVDLADSDYFAAYNGVTEAMKANPGNTTLPYLRGNLSKNCFRYAAAVGDLQGLVDKGQVDFPDIYRSLAECYYYLGVYDKALEYADHAIGSATTPEDAYVVKSDIKRAMGRPIEAVYAADDALRNDPKYAPALIAQGLGLLDQGLVSDASIGIGKAMLAVPNDPYTRILRGWVLDKHQDMPEQAAKFYEEALSLKGVDAKDVKSLRGFALQALGRNDEAVAWMDEVLAALPEQRSEGETDYYAACLYAQTGHADRAFEAMERALKKGYANKHAWTRLADTNINVAPLRDDPRFNELMARYGFLFLN